MYKSIETAIKSDIETAIKLHRGREIVLTYVPGAIVRIPFFPLSLFPSLSDFLLPEEKLCSAKGRKPML